MRNYNFLNSGFERGASLVEFALLVALVALTGVGSMTHFGNQMSGVFYKVAPDAVEVVAACTVGQRQPEGVVCTNPLTKQK